MSMLKERFRRLILLTAALVLCLTGIQASVSLSAAKAEEEMEIVPSYPYTTVTKDKVNLRASRSVRSELLRKIPSGAEITVSAVSGSWAKVTYGRYNGYVMTDYIVLKKVGKVKVTPTPTPVPTLSPEEDAGGYQVLQKGSSGREVRALQEALIELGYLTGTADGVFGDATEKAVIAFQQKNNYPATGLMDANIQAFLYADKPKDAKGNATKINTLSPSAGVTMTKGKKGQAVGELQARLKELGYYSGIVTNIYDVATQSAVKAFQKKTGLKADGIAGAETQKALADAAAPAANAEVTPAATETPAPTPSPTPELPKDTVKLNSTGSDAKIVQTRLKELGYYRGNLDGKFGANSVNALKAFQRAHGLKDDGIAGKETAAVLFSGAALPNGTTPTPAPGQATVQTPVPATAVPISWDSLRLNDQGTDVKQLQEALVQLGYMSGKPDGKYGAKTVNAVKTFQKNNNLTADGVAGEKTLKLLFSGTAKAASTAAPAAKATATPAPKATATPVPGTLREGDKGTEVQSMQEKLIGLGYLTGKADGVFGRQTLEAVIAFQKASRLTADGVAGSKTLAALSKSAPAATAASQTVTVTPAPAAAAVTSRPSASKVLYANWYTTVKAVARQYPYATVYDYQTGISWQVHIFSLGAHADYEPLTANDTSKMLKVFGGNTWNARPVWVIFADGSVYMGSTHSTPHGTQHITDNNFAGHSCLHFPRTQEQVTAIGPYATSHQDTIDKGWAATQQMK